MKLKDTDSICFQCSHFVDFCCKVSPYPDMRCIVVPGFECCYPDQFEPLQLTLF